MVDDGSGSHLLDHEVFKSIAEKLYKAKKCAVVVGAGISVAAGIPDFRSANGLYNLVKERYPNAVLKGKDLFDASLFRDPESTALFYTFMAELKSLVSGANLTRTHHFIKGLDVKGKLLRCYTQNIDCLENRLSLSSDATSTTRLIHLHGDLEFVVCTLCRTRYPFSEDHLSHFRLGYPPACPQCHEASNLRVASGRRNLACGTLRPNVVLYNEHHIGGDDIAGVVAGDARRRPDVLIVAGTSLKVDGVRRLVRDLAKSVRGGAGCNNSGQSGAAGPSSSRKSISTKITTSAAAVAAASSNGRGVTVFVNRTPPAKEWETVFDYHILGDSDEVIEALEAELEKLEGIARKKKEEAEKRKLKKAAAVSAVPVTFSSNNSSIVSITSSSKSIKDTKLVNGGGVCSQRISTHLPADVVKGVEGMTMSGNGTSGIEAEMVGSSGSDAGGGHTDQENGDPLPVRRISRVNSNPMKDFANISQMNISSPTMSRRLPQSSTNNNPNLAHVKNGLSVSTTKTSSATVTASAVVSIKSGSDCPASDDVVVSKGKDDKITSPAKRSANNSPTPYSGDSISISTSATTAAATFADSAATLSSSTCISLSSHLCDQNSSTRPVLKASVSSASKTAPVSPSKKQKRIYLSVSPVAGARQGVAVVDIGALATVGSPNVLIPKRSVSVSTSPVAGAVVVNTTVPVKRRSTRSALGTPVGIAEVFKTSKTGSGTTRTS